MRQCYMNGGKAKTPPINKAKPVLVKLAPNNLLEKWPVSKAGE
jgi:hypothetical protein